MLARVNARPSGVGCSECRSETNCLLIFLDGKNARPDDLSEAVIGNFLKESTAIGWQSPLCLLTAAGHYLARLTFSERKVTCLSLNLRCSESWPALPSWQKRRMMRRNLSLSS